MAELRTARTEDREEIRPAPAPRSEFAGPLRRLAAGVADLIVHAAVGVLALLGCRWLEVRPDVHEWPAFTTFLGTRIAWPSASGCLLGEVRGVWLAGVAAGEVPRGRLLLREVA